MYARLVLVNGSNQHQIVRYLLKNAHVPSNQGLEVLSRAVVADIEQITMRKLYLRIT